MQTEKPLRGSVVLYFVLVFVLTWGAIAALALGAVGLAPDARVAIVALPMLLVPAAVSVILTGVLERASGLRALWGRMTHWRVPLRWYVGAVGVMPVIVLAVLGLLSVGVSPAYRPALSWMGLAGIVAGYLEEFGWTGYATPRLLTRWSAWRVGLVVGLLWGLWHGLADYTIRGAAQGSFWPVTFALFVLPVWAWRLIMVRVYGATRSGPIAQLLHFSYTGSLALLEPVLAPSQSALIYAVLAIVLWLIVALVYRRSPASAAIDDLSAAITR